MERNRRGQFVRGHIGFGEMLRIKFKTDIVKRYLNGESSIKIAKSENCDKSSVLEELKRKEIKRRTIYDALVGRKLSKSTKYKMAQRMMGDKNPMYGKRGKEAPMYGKRGKDNPNWKGGYDSENKRIRKQIEFRLWREAVFARDNWTCRRCNRRKRINLNPHHLQNFAQYPELRFAIDNGITLCEECHKKFHKKYGYKNNTKFQWLEFAGSQKDIEFK